MQAHYNLEPQTNTVSDFTAIIFCHLRSLTGQLRKTNTFIITLVTGPLYQYCGHIHVGYILSSSELMMILRAIFFMLQRKLSGHITELIQKKAGNMI